MAYDSDREVTVLFGGFYYPNSYQLGDTWEWDGTTWTLRSSTGPSPRDSVAMVYDSARGVTMLFGGHDWFYPYANGDTWEWDGTTWTLLSTASYPSPRYNHGMVFDSIREVAVLFGGYEGSGPSRIRADTWEWDGAEWTELITAGPSTGATHKMAYDSTRGITVLFGLSQPNYDNAQTWEFEQAPFDDDCDGAIDFQDMAAFQQCFAPGQTPRSECAHFDHSSAEGIDLADFAEFMVVLSGPDRH